MPSSSCSSRNRRSGRLARCLLGAALPGVFWPLSIVTDWYEDWYVENKMRYYEIRDEFPDPAAQHLISLIIRGDVDGALAEAPRVPGGINVASKGGMTPLLVAVRNQDRPTVDALLKAGANPNGAPCGAPLIMIVQSHDLTIARDLLAAGADPNGPPGCTSPLAEAASHNNKEAVDFLLEARAKVDQPDAVGNTPAMEAMFSDHPEMAIYLLDHGASLWAASKGGVTIADLAADNLSHKATARPEFNEANDALISRLKAAHYPWPPPSVREVEKLLKAGQWPPKEAREQSDSPASTPAR